MKLINSFCIYFAVILILSCSNTLNDLKSDDNNPSNNNNPVNDNDPEAVNNAPVAGDLIITARENTPYAFQITFSDADGDSLTMNIVSKPSHGSLSGTLPDLTYTPDPDTSGYDSFTFLVNDGKADSNIATVTITIIPDNVLFVKKDAPAGGDGLSWDTAYNLIQDAVTNATSGYQVWVAAGTYTRKNTDTVVLTMKQGVEIYGGFSGNEYEIAERDYENNLTMLDGENAAEHVVTGASDARLDGFTVTRGRADSSEYGGGIYNNNCSNTLIIENCIIRNNYCSTRGGGMLNLNSSPSVINCIFSENESGYGGGGVGNYSYSGPTSSPDIINCIFIKNEAGEGGGIYIWTGAAGRLINCLFIDNFLYGTSGNEAMLIKNGATVSIINCTFYHTGGIQNSGSLTMKNSILWIFAETGPILYIETGGSSSITYSIIDMGWNGDGQPYTGTGNLYTDPLWPTCTQTCTYDPVTHEPTSCSVVCLPISYTNLNYHLEQTAAGQDENSPCVDAGDPNTSQEVLDILAGRTTRTDGIPDTGTVDMGYHYKP